MKKLIRTAWFRRSVQALLVVVSLLVLTATGANRWAAGEKHAAIKKLAPGGDLVESARFKRPMPPDSENFAMIPLMVQLREEEARSQGTPGVMIGAKLYELGLDKQGATLRFPPDGGPPDLAMISDKLALTGTAGEVLEQFDRRHREVLAGLREGMDRPHVVSPERFDPANPREAFAASSGGLMRFMNAAIGLSVRTELAMMAGNGEVALESVLLARLLSDLAFSDTSAVGKMVAWNVDRYQMIPRLRKGIESGAWDRAQLEVIRNAWSRRDAKAAIARTLNFEGVGMAILYDHAKRDRSLMIGLTTTKMDYPTRLRLEAIPDAWFDANSAEIFNRTGKWLEVIQQDRPLLSWWEAAAAVDSRPASWMDNILTWWGGHPDEQSSVPLVRVGSRAMVDDALARLACLLARISHKGNRPLC